VPTERFLKQRAVKIAVDGHYTLPNRYDPKGRLRTFTCRTTRISPYRMLVDVPVLGKVGDRLTSYFREFGKLDGHISDTKPGRFLLELDVSHAMREKLSNKLTWLEGKLKDRKIVDKRWHPRVVTGAAVFDGDPCRRQHPRVQRHRHVDERSCGLRADSAADRHAACGRRLRRPCRQIFCRRLCDQVRRNATPI